MSTSVRPLRVVLVGPIQQENLALQYLAASARRAGHEAFVVAYNDRADLDATVREVLAREPDLVGLGVAFQNSIEDYLAFMRAVRPRGFQGHLTCGGHVPTFCSVELLRDVPDLDTCVRHEGEETLVEMLACLARGEAPRGIAGLVWREGDRAVEGPVRRPVVELDTLPPPARSAEPYVVGGVTVDFVITARGCVGECNYYLGRTHLPIHNQSAISLCREHGIVPSFNFMLFDPDCSLDDVTATLDMAEQHLDLPWNVCRTEVYSGTALRTRLLNEGRLTGDYRSYGYRMRDARAEVMFRVLRVCLHERALALESLLNRLISISFARQIHERLFPGTVTEELNRAAMSLGVEVRRDTVLVLRRVLDFVSSADLHDKKAVQRFSVEQALAINARDLAWRARADDLWRRFNARGVAMMGRRGAPVAPRVRAGWGVAAGS